MVEPSVDGNVYIGPAGWSYPDWKGIVYEKSQSSHVAGLTVISSLFDLVEINVTFYRPITATLCTHWLSTIRTNPRFVFTVKAPRLLTHERGEQPDASCAQQFRESLAPLIESHRLGAVLLQFPWSFIRSRLHRAYLSRLTDLFSELPLCIEMRHDSWIHPEFFKGLTERKIAFCAIDQPLLHSCIRTFVKITAPFAYIRLHGRNREHWFKEGSSRDQRYDYLYTREELAPWIEKIIGLRREVQDLFVVTNNHYRGQAVVNALELQAALGLKRGPVPHCLLNTYPHLKEMADDTLCPPSLF